MAPRAMRRPSVVAGPAAGIAERPPRDRDELPLIASRPEGELEHAEGVLVVRLGVRDRRAERVVARAAGAGDELPDAAREILLAGRGLRREALVVVVVAHHDD